MFIRNCRRKKRSAPCCWNRWHLRSTIEDGEGTTSPILCYAESAGDEREMGDVADQFSDNFANERNEEAMEERTLK